MEIENKKFAIIGFGKSGQNASKLINKYNGKLFISNNKKFNKEQMDLINTFNCDFEENHTNRILDNDYIIISPGIDMNNTVMQKALKANIPIIPEIELAYNILNTKIIGITGTNGKSTTTYLIYQLLSLLNIDCEYGGNISPGKSLSEIAIENGETKKIIVCELSSFQLEYINAFKPFIGIITNITEDHIDKHKTFENYMNSKLNIFKNMTNDNYAILNYDDKNLKNLRISPTTFFISLDNSSSNAYFDKNTNSINIDINNKKIKINIDDFSLPGEHNIFNLTVSLLTTYLIKPFDNSINNIIKHLKGLEHRMEFVRELHSIKFYNNSMCTNPIAFYNSLKAFNKKQTVIVGGRNKDFNIDIIINSIVKFAKNAVLIGESSDLVYNILKKHNYKNIYKAHSLEEAIDISLKISEKNSIVNFSPGFASFDMFENFIDRGNKFKKIVGELDEN